MPKENINSAVPNVEGLCRASVSWGRTSEVQIGTEYSPSSFEVADSTPLYSCLDRDGLNRLIRVLRRARDQAYGRDE